MIPVDMKRCQAESRSFMTLGPGYVRCSNAPTHVATESEPGPDGKKGSMSLCEACKGVMEKQMPGHALFVKIVKAK